MAEDQANGCSHPARCQELKLQTRHDQGVLAQGSTRDCTRPGWETRLSGTTAGVGLGGVPHASWRVQEICRHELHTRCPHVETGLSAHRRRPPPLP
eukprot:COSAG06_NODE_8031_length_2293_cov_10.722425_1_plen_95_part_10